MTSRYLPYATTPARLFAQLVSDVVVVAWTGVWALVGIAVHAAVSTIAHVGRQVKDGANGVADNLNSAGDSADHVPLVGHSLSKPLRAASDAALDIAGAGHSLDTTASWLAWVLALAVASPPILAVVMPWLFVRVRFFRRKWTAITLAATPAGEQLLALRALANRPLAKLAAVSMDPVGAWRRDDAIAVAWPGQPGAAGRRAPAARSPLPLAPSPSRFRRVQRRPAPAATPKSGDSEPTGQSLRRLDRAERSVAIAGRRNNPAQARGGGLEPGFDHRRVRAGTWTRCCPGVYFVDDRPFTDSARVRAAVWGYGQVQLRADSRPRGGTVSPSSRLTSSKSPFPGTASRHRERYPPS